MMQNTREDLKRTFELVTMRKRAKILARPAEAEKVHEITTRYARETKKQERLYRAEYDTRVEKALQARIDKAGAKTKTLKHRLFGSDNFDGSANLRQAHREVQHDHARRIAQLQIHETQELDSLVATAEQRQLLKSDLSDAVKPSFARATDRRVTPERRTSRSPSRTR